MSPDLNLPLALLFLLVVAVIASVSLAHQGTQWLACRLGYPLFDQPQAYEAARPRATHQRPPAR